jgi:hypothetical protein
VFAALQRVVLRSGRELLRRDAAIECTGDATPSCLPVLTSLRLRAVRYTDRSAILIERRTRSSPNN